MHFGPVELIEERAKSVLGKRIKGKEECNPDMNEQNIIMKRGKTSVALDQNEMVWVSEHPRQAQ